MFFQDWRVCDTSIVPFDLDKEYLYYFQAKAWGFKGIIGGTHSWMAFWSPERNEWLVIEITDAETVHVQQGEIVYTTVAGWTEQGPVISNRDPRQQWFGGKPLFIAKQKNYCTLAGFKQLVDNYPIKKFALLFRNCNTLTSYIIAALDLKFTRPFRSVGHRSRIWWRKHYGI